MASIAATPSVSASVLHTRVPMDPAAPVTISVSIASLNFWLLCFALLLGTSTLPKKAFLGDFSSSFQLSLEKQRQNSDGLGLWLNFLR